MEGDGIPDKHCWIFFNIKAIKTFLSVKQLENFYYKKIKSKLLENFLFHLNSNAMNIWEKSINGKLFI